MKLSRLYFLAFGLFAAVLVPQMANAGFAPSSIGTAIEKAAQTHTEQVRGGHGGGGRGFRGHGGGGRGFRGHGGYRHVYRGGPRWGHRGRYWGGPVYYGGYYASCIRRGWVWNGWRYVWRRYRVC